MTDFNCHHQGYYVWLMRRREMHGSQPVAAAYFVRALRFVYHATFSRRAHIFKAPALLCPAPQ
jgi:hypothetical protein